MCGKIDTAGKTGDNDKSGATESASQPVGEG
jgi:hypothetical protein